MTSTLFSLSSQTPSQRNNTLLLETSRLQQEIVQLKEERDKLRQVFARLQEQYAEGELGERYNERRYIMLKSMMEQKDRLVSAI